MVPLPSVVGSQPVALDWASRWMCPPQDSLKKSPTGDFWFDWVWSGAACMALLSNSWIVVILCGLEVTNFSPRREELRRRSSQRAEAAAKSGGSPWLSRQAKLGNGGVSIHQLFWLISLARIDQKDSKLPKKVRLLKFELLKDPTRDAFWNIGKI